MEWLQSVYFQFVQFIQGIPTWIFIGIFVVLFCTALLLIVKFFKKYNGEQKKFEKVSYIVFALIILAIIIYLTIIRK